MIKTGDNCNVGESLEKLAPAIFTVAVAGQVLGVVMQSLRNSKNQWICNACKKQIVAPVIDQREGYCIFCRKKLIEII